MDILRRIGTEPQSAPGQLQKSSTFPSSLDPVTPRFAARTRDPNAPENKYQVNQKCIYERRLPGGSYITAHLQRLQSGYYDTALIHEDLIDNVRFVAINFVFHPSRSSFRFKSAEIRVALHNVFTDNSDPLGKVVDKVTGQGPVPDPRRHSHATQTTVEEGNGVVVKYDTEIRKVSPTPKKVTRPKFLRHAPHLLYGAVSPETLDWNFNVAGSVGAAYGPANATLNPSMGLKSSYKLYEMMKIQGSVRTLRSWYGHEYDIEDGELVWTLEENTLQKSGLPREFTFVMLLTKGSSNFDPGEEGDLTLDVDIDPKIAGWFGQGSFPKAVTNMHKYRPYHYPPVDLDLEVGQVFEPVEKGKGFNFARLSSQFDDYVFLPGTTHSKSDAFMGGQGQSQDQPSGNQSATKPPTATSSTAKAALPASTNGNTLNVRLYLDNARGSPAPLAAPMSYLHLRPPSRNPSPLLAPSVTGSHKSQKRTITISSKHPSDARSRHTSHSSARERPQSYIDGQRDSAYVRPHHRQHSLRKTRSRSELNSEYNSSPVQEKSQLSHDLRSSPLPEETPIMHDFVGNDHATSRAQEPIEIAAHWSTTNPRTSALPDSETLPQHEFSPVKRLFETPAAARADIDKKRPIVEPPLPRSGTDGTNEYMTPPQTSAELEASPRLRPQRSRVRSRPTSNAYSDVPSNLKTRGWESDDSLVGSKGQQVVPPNLSAEAEPTTSKPASRGAETLSYDPVREAMRLAMQEHEQGMGPGEMSSSGFRGSMPRKPLPVSSTVARAVPLPATPASTQTAHDSRQDRGPTALPHPLAQNSHDHASQADAGINKPHSKRVSSSEAPHYGDENTAGSATGKRRTIRYSYPHSMAASNSTSADTSMQPQSRNTTRIPEAGPISLVPKQQAEAIARQEYYRNKVETQGWKAHQQSYEDLPRREIIESYSVESLGAESLDDEARRGREEKLGRLGHGW